MARALFIVTIVFLGSWLPVGLTTHNFYHYQIGTPTTATFTYCSTGKGSACRGTWNVGGQSQTGPMVGMNGPIGSPVGVHVDDGVAYPASTAVWFSLSLGAMIILAILFTRFSFVLIRRWVRTAPSSS